ncbi:MAG TPA: DUF1998 domain-containing protein [Gammaproteobacteria bacterium]|nr:DUF1998 domain-containing protein [Gammaproteobacteria bacterium]
MIYRSAGLTLNWHVPADQEDVKEVQNIKFAWRCQKCGDSGTTHSFHESGVCPSCGADIKSGNQRQFIEPAGFAVDFYETPNNNVDNQQFVPVESPWIALDSDWLSLPNPDLGRFRTTTKGHIFHQSRGINGTGYALCLECGRTEPMTPDGVMPERFAKPHRKLRRGKDDAPECPGSNDSWKIKEGITLGHETWTDACEFQLKSTQGHWLNDKVAAITLAVALRDALAELIGVENTELACATRQVRTDEGGLCRAIVLFDRYAAGYASSVPRYLRELFHKARAKLLCSNDCDSVCPHCVLDFDQRFAVEDMDRHKALDFLTEQWVTGFRVPEQYAFFGEQSQPDFSPLLESIWSAVAKGAVKAIRLQTGGEPDQWDIALSPLRQLAYQIASKGVQVSILTPASVLEQLDETERNLLASLADAPDIEVYALEAPVRCGEGWLLVETLSTETERWAGDTQSSLVFGPDWGQVENLLVSAREPEAPALDATRIDADTLRPVATVLGDRELEIGGELNGKLKTFGKRFWNYLGKKHEPVQMQLDATDPVTFIRYQDRYFFSPLSVRLLFEIVKALRARVGEERWPLPTLEIETLECRPRTRRNGPPQRFLWSDWDNNATRTEVIKSLFNGIDARPRIKLNSLHQQAHGRMLEIVFSSGKSLRIRFDQGVSYWRVARSVDSHSKAFNFSETDSKRQVARLMRADVNLEGAEQKTQLFIKVVTAKPD